MEFAEQNSDYKVYVKTDENGRITEINSSAFLQNTEGWTEIDSGIGDKFHHAQNNYFSEPLTDTDGVYNYKLSGGQASARTAAELAAEREELRLKKQKTARIAELKKRLADTDYAVIKIAEGSAAAEDYADIISSRKAWRAEINSLEATV